MQSLKQDRTVRSKAREEIWCLKCNGHMHDKDHFPVFANYITGGGSVPLRSKAQEGLSLWCAICHVALIIVIFAKVRTNTATNVLQLL